MSYLDRRGKKLFKILRVVHKNNSRVSPVQLSLKLEKLRLIEVFWFLDPQKATISPRNAQFPLGVPPGENFH